MMQVPNPLVPSPLGAGGGPPAPVANAPNVSNPPKHQTARPVTAAKEADRAQPERPRGGHKQRGGHLDVTV